MYTCFFIFLLCFYNTTFSAGLTEQKQKTVIMIHGASRSGKSSLCSALDAHEGWRSVGSLYGAYCLMTCEKLFPEQLACIKAGIEESNIRHALASSFCIFKKNISLGSVYQI